MIRLPERSVEQDRLPDSTRSVIKKATPLHRNDEACVIPLYNHLQRPKDRRLAMIGVAAELLQSDCSAIRGSLLILNLRITF